MQVIGCETRAMAWFPGWGPDPWIETLSALLFRRWDVVGVAEIDIEPEREYIYEAGRVLAVLKAGGGVDAVAAELAMLAAEMPVAPNPSRDRTAAEAIVTVWQAR
jgi:hypothetical protein